MSEDIPIAGIDEYPVTQSVKIRGPPGCGKTAQATRRVEELIENHGYEVDDLTWVTYRRSLARDVMQSLEEAGILNATDTTRPSRGRTRYITTTHAAAFRACAPKEMYQMQPASRGDRIDFVTNEYNVSYDSPDNSNRKPRGEKAFDVIKWCHNTRTSFHKANTAPAYVDYRDEWPRGPSISEIASEWAEYKDEHGLYDFHEQLTTALESSDTPPTGIVVIDEHHDATPLMDKVMRKWVSEADVAIVIGDPQQTLNTHEGADPQLFRRIDLPTVNLTRTYRVPEQQWSIAQRLIKSHHSVPDVDTVNDDGVVRDKQSPRFERRDGEWRSIPVNVTESPDDFAEAHDDLMFLTRTKLQADGVAASLRQTGHVFRSQSGIDSWDSDDRRLSRLNALLKLQNGCNTLRAQEATELIELTDNSHYTKPDEKIWEHIYDLRRQDDDIHVSLSFVRSLMSKNWLSVYSQGKSSVSQLSEPANGDLDIGMLEAALERYDEPVGYDLTEYPAVLTIHASKGMEAENVVLYDAIPHIIRQSTLFNHSHRATEDRVWYVGVTRSSHRLYVMRDAFNWTISYLPRGISATSSITTGATTND